MHYVENEIESNAGEAGADDERVEEEAERRAEGGRGGAEAAGEDEDEPSCCCCRAGGRDVEDSDGAPRAAAGGYAGSDGYGRCDKGNNERPSQRCKFGRDAHNIHAKRVMKRCRKRRRGGEVMGTLKCWKMRSKAPS